MIHIAALSSDSGDKIYLLRRAQITYLKVNEASIEVCPSEYTDFVDIFLPKLAAKIPKYTGINDHAIELGDDWQSSNGLTYSLSLLELKTLKAYIKNNLTNGFIRSSKSLVRCAIFFNKKPDKSLRLCVNHSDLKNLIIKIWYLLSLVGKSLDWLG